MRDRGNDSARPIGHDSLRRLCERAPGVHDVIDDDGGAIGDIANYMKHLSHVLARAPLVRDGELCAQTLSVGPRALRADAKVVQTFFNRGTSYQSVRMKLASPESLQEIKAFAENESRLNVEIKTEADYYAAQSKPITNLIRYIGYPLAFIMALGALAGALNTMYTSVLVRMGEITTLRALGFGAFPSFVGILTESIVIAVFGSAIGLVLAYVFFDGMLVSTLNGASFTQAVFEFSVSAQLIKHALALSVLIGFVGGFFPALRAARMPIADAFRITQT